MYRRSALLLLILASGGFVVTQRFNYIYSIVRNEVLSAFARLPQGLQILLGLLVLVLGIIGGLWIVAKLVYLGFKSVAYLISKGGSPSPMLTVAIGGACTLAVVFIASLVVLGGTTSIWDSDSGATGQASDLQESGMSSSLSDVVEGDTVRPSGLNNADSRCSKPSGVDSDGDRLPDTWEQRGSTPNGAPLPEADPDRKDIYIQPIYEPGAERFTEKEKQQLRRVWAEMPVTNPNGQTGIKLHFVDRLPNQGRVESPVLLSNFQSLRNQYYTQESIGPGLCRYHLVAIGTSSSESRAGRGDAPGFVSAVDSTRRPSYDGSVTFRVAVTTHELLHNIAGTVKGKLHPGTGWLGGDGEYLGAETKRDLNSGFAPPKSYWS